MVQDPFENPNSQEETDDILDRYDDQELSPEWQEDSLDELFAKPAKRKIRRTTEEKAMGLTIPQVKAYRAK